MVLIWFAASAVLEKMGYITIIYELMKVVTFFFFFPVSFLGLKLFEKYLGKGYLFTPISYVWELLALVLLSAGIATAVAVYMLKRDEQQLKEHYSDTFEPKLWEKKVLTELCKELKIPEQRIIYGNSYRVRSPFIMGTRQGTIILPAENCREEVLRAVLVHELMHYKQKDLWLKRAASLAVVLHFYNPLIWIFNERVQKWGEFACDSRACSHCGGVKNYYELLLEFLLGEKVDIYLSSQLFKTKGELGERVEKMCNANRSKKKTKIGLALVLCLTFVVSGLSVCATTVQAAKAYEYLYKTFEDVTSEEVSTEVEVEYVEYTESGETPGLTLIEMPTNTMARTTYGLDWDVPAGSRVSASYHLLTAGQQVAVSVSIVPSDVTVKVGLENSAGTRRYVTGSNLVYYVFDIEELGSYRVYIQNDSSTALTVEGSYIIK